MRMARASPGSSCSASSSSGDLKGFRSITSKLTGHGESHLFPAGVMVSNGPLGSSLPIAQGLALADGKAEQHFWT